MLSEQANHLADSGNRPTPRRGPGRPTRSNAELLDLSLDLFLENGFERTSIDAICVAAGMAKRTVYSRYGDKTNLFKAALKRAIEQWIVPIERLRAAEGESLEETLLSIARILVANIMSPAGLRLMRLTNAESGRMPDIGVYNIKHGTGPTLAYLADLFSRYNVQGGASLPEADKAALAFLHLVVGGPANNAAWGVVLDEEEIDQHTRYSVRLILHGLLPQTGGNASAQEQARLEEENLRLKKLFAEAMIQLDEARERLELQAGEA